MNFNLIKSNKKNENKREKLKLDPINGQNIEIRFYIK